ncbi:MAG: hypothetical protein EOP86_04090, partial [Verrucomicrobiaceae bacterium]
MNHFDFSFFDEALKRVRRLRSYTFPWYVMGAVPDIFGSSPGFQIPKMLSIQADPETGDGEYIFEAASYAAVPGHGLAEVQKMVGNPLPPDLLAFYERYEKALAVTRTYPLHLWPEEALYLLERGTLDVYWEPHCQDVSSEGMEHGEGVSGVQRGGEERYVGDRTTDEFPANKLEGLPMSLQSGYASLVGTLGL